MYPFLPPLLSPLLWKRFFTNQFIVNIKQSEQLISWKVETDACEVPPGPQIADTPIPAHVGPRINHPNLVIWWVPLLIRKNLKPFCRVKDFWAVLLYFNESKTIPSTWMGNSASHTFPSGHHILSYGWAHKMGCSSWWRGFYMFFFFWVGGFYMLLIGWTEIPPMGVSYFTISAVGWIIGPHPMDSLDWWLKCPDIREH